MKEMNRREFLTLSGAAVVALSLAGCGAPSAPSAPATPTGKEAKVLDALNLYRGKLSPLTPDSGLDPAMKIVVKLAKGDIEYNEANMNALVAAAADYKGIWKPIGIRMDNDSTHATPVCVYSDNAEDMALSLNNLLDEGDKAKLSSSAITLVNIKTFEHKGTTYWVALIAEGKVKP